jgi:hypothetical protein
MVAMGFQILMAESESAARARRQEAGRPAADGLGASLVQFGVQFPAAERGVQLLQRRHGQIVGWCFSASVAASQPAMVV